MRPIRGSEAEGQKTCRSIFLEERWRDFSRSHPPSEPNLHGNSRHPPPLANPHTNTYSYGPPNHPPPVAHHHSHPPYGHAHQLSHVPIRDTNAIMPAEFVEPNKAVNSPTPPRSPSWREGLESPPFSPRRRDSYPGKKSRGSPVSPRDKKMHFTYNDLSPSPRAYSFDDGYEGQLRASVGGDTMSFSQHGVNSFSQRLSPKSPDEEKESFASAMAHQLHFELPPTRGAKTGSSTLSSFGHSGPDGAFVPPLVGQPLSLTGSGSAYVGSDMIGLPHSAPVMDLATFAATVASNTATLTSMTVSPTAILPHGATGMSSQHPEPLSPDSVDSTDSTSSPGSPGYYDNANSTSDDMEDMELADPTSKSIDMGSSKRQKARPPSTDWSPVIDLSPILDVSPSVEEAEQEDMLAKQLEELERQRSREESDMDRDDPDMEDDEDEDVHMVSMSASMSSSQDRSESFNPFALRSDQKLEDDSSDGLELTEFTSFSALRRYDKIEDISKIGDNCMDEDELIHVIATETADAAIAAALEEHKRQLLLNEDENGNPPSPSEDVPFPSCTSQAEATATCSTGPTTVTASMSTSVTSGGGFAEGTQEQDARSQRRALEAHISDEISKITQGMQDIVRRGAADVKPIPPPKPRRRLPEPTPEMTAAAAAVAATAASSSSYSMISPIQFAPPPSKSPSMSAHRKRKTNGPTPKVKAEARREEVVLKQAPVGCRPSEDARQNELADGANQTASAFMSASGTEADDSGIPRQDSAERRKAKDMKAKPSPLLIQHIEAEEQSVSPHYRVMDSPPTPENKLIKREFSESTSVSPSSSPDADHYMYPSPVTPPDSDLSPPKPHSPSSTGTDLDEDTLRYSSAGELSAAGSGSGVSTISAGAQSLSSQVNMDANVDLPSREREEGEPCLVKTFANPIVPIRSKAAGGPAADDNPIPAKPPLPVRPKPSPRTTEHTGPETEEGPSVRDKIRAFEQVTD
ncbi:hypothetical protein C0Q70_15624 [Pomacea canaliculata]|uniref:Uncharacterized protein n=1 Tax=Pomacea canaliculata TaxID=400727 RepID=A0A2T7NVF4_POMCA|nr:hypothetical protein C0Q70_15624 [Pomacea canaliculata]